MDALLQNLKRAGREKLPFIKDFALHLTKIERSELAGFLYFLTDREEQTWGTSHGMVRPVCDLEDSHLLNIFRCKARGGWTLKNQRLSIPYEMEDLLKKELEYRTLKYPGPLMCTCGHTEYQHEIKPRNVDRRYHSCEACDCELFDNSEYPRARLSGGPEGSTSIDAHEASGSSDSQEE